METSVKGAVEWAASGLRPVARWVTETDERGRRRLVMVWQVPDVDVELGHVAAATG
jgi:hypothetical protein